MLSSPLQNSDMQHRAEVISEMRNQEAILQNATRHNAEQMVKAEELRKEEQVGATEHSELDPDGKNSSDSQRRREHRSKSNSAKPGDDTPARPRRFMSGGHIDITV